MFKRFLKNLPFILVFILVSGCESFIKTFEGASYYEEIDLKGNSNSLSIYFSGNINGETHPCGCRHFPLGGLAQVAGEVISEGKVSNTLLVDSGDTFFPSPHLPESVKKSHIFVAREIAKQLSDIGLKYIVPGDQDFAAGAEFLKELAAGYKFQFLVSNFHESFKIKHRRWAKLKLKNRNLYIIGVADPSTFQSSHKIYFTDPYKAIEKAIKEVTEKGYSPNTDLLVMLSHSGFNTDKEFAKKFKNIDWIIGAHTQSFTQDPEVVGKTKIVQTLSRNHYLGKISIKYSGKQESEFNVVEIRDELKDKIKPNKYTAMLEEHKGKLLEIQKEEQSSLGSSFGPTDEIPVASSCVDCHDRQSEFWSGTPHSIAYYTLIKVKEYNNQKCVGCHSVGFKHKGGFDHPIDIVVFSKDHVKEKKDLEKLRNSYLDAVSRKLGKITSVRKTPTSEIKKHYSHWKKIDEKFQIEKNFSGVQCFNCHNQSANHAFQETSPIAKEEKLKQMRSRCIQCHTLDQSPEWYSKENKSLKEGMFVTNLKKVACPKRVEGDI